MPPSNPARATSRLANRIYEAYNKLDAEVGLEAVAAKTKGQHQLRAYLLPRLALLQLLLDDLDRQRLSWLGQTAPVLSGISERQRDRLRAIDERLAPTIRAAFAAVAVPDLEELDDLLELASDGEASNSPLADSTTGVPADHTDTGGIDSIFYAGIDFARQSADDGTGPWSSDQVDEAELLLSTSWFEPDEWLAVARELPVVMLDAHHTTFPPWLRVRMYDLFRAAVTTNYLAAVALARATLEGALDEAADRVLTNVRGPEVKRMRRTRQHGLDSWIEHYRREGINLPYEAIERLIQRYGNSAMHPHRQARDLHSVRQRDVAVDCIRTVVMVVEVLYRDPVSAHSPGRR